MDAYRSLGLKRDTKTRFSSIRVKLNGRIDRRILKMFSAKFPDAFAEIERISHRSRTPVGYLRKVQNKDLFNFLYPEHLNECRVCGAPTRWSNSVCTYTEHCSTRCVSQSSVVADRRKHTALERFGCEPNLHPKVQAKKRRTFLKRYGVDNPTKSPAVIERMQARSLRLHGVRHWTQKAGAVINRPMDDPAVVTGIRERCMREHGVSWHSKRPEVQERMMQTCMKRYCVPNGGVFNGSKLDVVKDRFGVEHAVQGTEARVIKYLDGIQSVRKIISLPGQMPEVRFGNRRYIPDLMATTADGVHLIECKHAYTFLAGIEDIARKSRAATSVMNKRGGCFWLFVIKGERIHRIKNPRGISDLVPLVREVSPQLGALIPR